MNYRFLSETDDHPEQQPDVIFERFDTGVRVRLNIQLTLGYQINRGEALVDNGDVSLVVYYAEGPDAGPDLCNLQSVFVFEGLDLSDITRLSYRYVDESQPFLDGEDQMVMDFAD